MKIETLIARFNGVCLYCGVDVDPHGKPDAPNTATRDHFIPLSKGGARGATNTVLACNECNRAKGDMDPRKILYVWLRLDARGLLEIMEQCTAQASPRRRMLN